MAEESQWIINTSDETFEADVLARSELGLVVVDFWADWCAPCRMIGPVLEKLAIAGEGRFTLVKALTDDNEAVAQELSIAGLPTVMAVLNQQVIDRFEGALPPQQIEQWLASLESHAAIADAKRIGENDPVEAENKLRELLAESPDNAAIKIALAEVLMNAERLNDASQIVDELESRGFLEPEAEQLKAALVLKDKGSINIEAARTAAESNPDDFDSQFAFAEALVGNEQFTEAFDICLKLVEQDRKNTGEQARALMVEVFQALPGDSELVNDYRRRLSMLLY